MYPFRTKKFEQISVAFCVLTELPSFCHYCALISMDFSRPLRQDSLFVIASKITTIVPLR